MDRTRPAAPHLRPPGDGGLRTAPAVRAAGSGWTWLPTAWAWSSDNLSVCFWQRVTPGGVRGAQKIRVVETAVAGNLDSDEIGLFEGFVHRSQLYLCHDKTGIVAEKLVHFPHVAAISTAHEITVLVDDSTPAQTQEVARLVEGYLLLKLITAESAVLRTALDGEVGMVIAYADRNLRSISTPLIASIP